MPLEAGAVDDDYRLVFAAVVVPILRQFAPDLVLVSAGFDAHERDPLGGMRLTTGAFAAMTAELRGVADACCDGRIVLVTEGGYDLQALAASLDAVVETLRGTGTSPDWSRSGIPDARGETAVTALKTHLGDIWSL